MDMQHESLIMEIIGCSDLSTKFLSHVALNHSVVSIKSCHDSNFVVTGGTTGCQNDKLWYGLESFYDFDLSKNQELS